MRVEGQSHRKDNVAGGKLYRLTALFSVETRPCDFVKGVVHPAEYEAEYLDGSRSFVCPVHATELVQRAGWHLADAFETTGPETDGS